MVGPAADSLIITVECIPQLDNPVSLTLADDTSTMPELEEVVGQSLHPVVAWDGIRSDGLILQDSSEVMQAKLLSLIQTSRMVEARPRYEHGRSL